MRRALYGALSLGFLSLAVTPVQAYIPPDSHYLCDFPQNINVYKYQRWYPEELPIKVYIPPLRIQLPHNYYALAQQAFLNWSARVPQFQFQWVNDPKAAQIQVDWEAHFPESESAWGKALFPMPRRMEDGSIKHFSVVKLALKSQQGTGLTGESAFFSPSEFSAIATHEAGHALGLPHSKNREDLMTPYLNRLTASHQWRITQQDVSTLLYLYSLPRDLKVPPCNGA